MVVLRAGPAKELRRAYLKLARELRRDEQRNRDNNQSSLANLCGGMAEAYDCCAADLRRLTEAAIKRQPQHNDSGETRLRSPNSQNHE